MNETKDNKQPSGLREVLPGIASDHYGERYRDHVLDIYKLAVEMADRISSRRDKANSFFLTVSTAIIAVMSSGIIGGDGMNGSTASFVSVAGVVICYLWYRLIKSYRDLSSAKFKVIHAIEAQLPLRPFEAEWESVGRGENPKLYLPFTRVERWMPAVFSAVHFAMLLSGIEWGMILNAIC